MTPKIVEKIKEVEAAQGVKYFLPLNPEAEPGVLPHRTAIMTSVLYTVMKKTGIFPLGIRMKQ
jgi:hypothetical protein